MANVARNISLEILDLIDWVAGEAQTEYERGIIMGLRIAEALAEAVERNKNDDDI